MQQFRYNMSTYRKVSIQTESGVISKSELSIDTVTSYFRGQIRNEMQQNSSSDGLAISWNNISTQKQTIVNVGMQVSTKLESNFVTK